MAVEESLAQLLSLLTSVIILFIIGILDDFKDLSHRVKLPFQFVASGIVIYYWNLIPFDMGGVFGIHTIHSWWGWILMLFFFQFTINALNYTDGVNGLLGGYSLFVFGFLSMWAYAINETYIYPLLFLFSSGLLAFLFYNFRATAKTFMGDSGSTIIGFVASIVTARIIQIDPKVELSIGPIKQTLPVFYVFVMLFWYPLFDSLQVYMRRILSRRSPFIADRGHFHHYLMDLTGRNHLLTTTMILLITGMMVAGLLLSL